MMIRIVCLFVCLGGVECWGVVRVVIGGDVFVCFLKYGRYVVNKSTLYDHSVCCDNGVIIITPKFVSIENEYCHQKIVKN